MSDLGTQIRSYYEDVVERVDPTTRPVQRERKPTFSPALVLLASVALILVAIGLAPFLGRWVVDDPAVTEPSSTTITDAPTTTETPDEALPTTPLVSTLPDPPWSGEFLATDDVDAVLLDSWHEAANRGYCALLAPRALGPDGEGAVARTAGFTAGLEWFIAWDNPAGPGMTGNSQLCEDCGRSAFGIQGSAQLRTQPTSVKWNDGSGLTHGRQGSYEDGHERVRADLKVVGQPCSYAVWSSLGVDHLNWFVDQLRFVEGHYSEPVEIGSPGSTTVRSLGVAPWSAPHLRESDVDRLLLNRWAESSASQACPLLALAGLGDDAHEATIRQARFGGWGVAWDNPAGPGHDNQNEPCSDCGRGVIGLSGGRGGVNINPEATPHRVEWDDGSTAVFGYEGLLYNQLPLDLIDVRDPKTGDPTTPPIHAWIQPADNPECRYELWTHLGEEHLLDLFRQLRYVMIQP